MRQYVAAAPECLVVRMGDDNCGPRPRAQSHLVERDGGHCFLREAPEYRWRCWRTKPACSELSSSGFELESITDVIAESPRKDCSTRHTIVPERFWAVKGLSGSVLDWQTTRICWVFTSQLSP